MLRVLAHRHIKAAIKGRDFVLCYSIQCVINDGNDWTL
jgi:hypothetical protein